MPGVELAFQPVVDARDFRNVASAALVTITVLFEITGKNCPLDIGWHVPAGWAKLACIYGIPVV